MGAVGCPVISCSTVEAPVLALFVGPFPLGLGLLALRFLSFVFLLGSILLLPLFPLLFGSFPLLGGSPLLGGPSFLHEGKVCALGTGGGASGGVCIDEESLALLVGSGTFVPAVEVRFLQAPPEI